MTHRPFKIRRYRGVWRVQHITNRATSYTHWPTLQLAIAYADLMLQRIGGEGQR